MWITRLGILLALSAGVGTAGVVNFDDLSSQQNQAIPDGYGEIVWNGNWNASCCGFGSISAAATVADNPRFDFVTPDQYFNGLRVGFFGAVSVNLYDNDVLVSSFDVTGTADPFITRLFSPSSYAGTIDYVVFSLVSTPGPPTLSFFLLIDDVTFGNAAAVPEPATWWTALFAGAAAFYARRRRK